MTEPLSPAAQAVWDAANVRHGCTPSAIAAGSLRAVVDNAPAPHHHEETAFHSGFWAGIEYIRSIATELEAHQ